MEDLHSRWNHRWIHPNIKSGMSSIEGLGTFATKKILKNEPLLVFGGVVVPTKEIEQYRKIKDGPGHVGIQIDADFFICPTTRKELEETGAINHSCNPNTGFVNSIKIVAIKDIEQGEEVVFDYAFCETAFKEFRCNCGAENCRTVIRPTDWQLPELQKKYGEYFSPYLKQKINHHSQF